MLPSILQVASQAHWWLLSGGWGLFFALCSLHFDPSTFEVVGWWLFTVSQGLLAALCDPRSFGIVGSLGAVLCFLLTADLSLLLAVGFWLPFAPSTLMGVERLVCL